MKKFKKTEKCYKKTLLFSAATWIAFLTLKQYEMLKIVVERIISWSFRKEKEFSQKTPLCTKWFFKTKRKSISYQKKKKNHGHVHFENTMQGLVGSHDHLLGGLDVFPTDLNYVWPNPLEERCVGNLLKAR